MDENLDLNPNRNPGCNIDQRAIYAGKLPAAASDLPHLFAVFFLVLAVYLWSMPHTVVIEDDDGYFITAAFLNIYAHPPGYPLYCLLGKLATMFPYGSIAWRVHALSAICGALACSVMWCLVRYLVENHWLAWLASLGLAISAVFWSSSIVAEVYSLNILLFLLILLLLLRYAVTNKTSLLCWSALIYGLSLSNHWPLLLLSSPALLVLIWPAREKMIKDIKFAIPCLLAGLMPYVWMIYRSRIVPELNFDGPFLDWQDLWTFISRAHYAHMDINPGADWADRAQYILYTLQLTFTQYGYVGGLFILPGFILQWRIWPRHVNLALLFGYLGSTVALIMLLKFDFDFHHRLLFQVYPHIPFALSGLWLALGCGAFVKWVTIKVPGIQAGFLTGALVILILAGELAQNAPANYRAQDKYAEDYARVVLETLPRDAILYANSTTINAPAGYLNKVMRVRPDVDLYSGHAILVNGRLERLYKHGAAETRRLVSEFLRGTSRPVFYTDAFPHSCNAHDYGLYFYVDDENCDGPQHVYLRKPVIEFFRRLLVQPVPTYPWAREHVLLLRADYCQLLVNSLPPGPFSTAVMRDKEFAAACGGYHGLLALIENALARAPQDWVFVELLLARAGNLREDEAFTKAESARLDLLRGQMWLKRKRPQQAESAFRKALKIWNSAENPAQAYLLPADGA